MACLKYWLIQTTLITSVVLINAQSLAVRSRAVRRLATNAAKGSRSIPQSDCAAYYSLWRQLPSNWRHRWANIAAAAAAVAKRCFADRLLLRD